MALVTTCVRPSYSTSSGLAQDVFYLTDSETGEPVTEPERLAEARTRLLDVTA